MPDKHSVLSPSSSSRWYHCQRSARLCEQVPDEGSIYSAEGTDAHALCEYLLKQAMGKPCADPRPQMQFYSPEMEEAARGYVQYVLEKAEAMRQSGTEPLVFAEQLLDLRAYVPQSAGTADCVVIGGDRALIVDFKYGFRPVPAESLQLRLYALGVCEMFSSIYEIRTVSTAIYQPRISAVSEAAYTVEELYTWAREELAPRARLAFDGAGNFEVGEWCHFCKVRRNCRALADHELELARYEFRDPALLSDEEIAEVLLRADALVSWANHVKEFALSEALKGHVYPGFKVVEGRAVRRYTDDAEVASRVEAAGKDPYEHRLLGITAMEKLLGKKEFSDLLSDLVSRPEGKPTLVPVSDKRPEMNSPVRDFV
ncbi:MAG: DUF2800 domain-containing protein [Clostridia bacterium]|nr:DUF2800 domain-containing protein [Clostridia bacterium]